jgi:hypothetical protein
MRDKSLLGLRGGVVCVLIFVTSALIDVFVWIGWKVMSSGNCVVADFFVS